MSKPQRRRANGQGSIWYDDKRKRYVAQISVHTDDGALHRRTVFAKTQVEVERRLRQLKIEAALSDELDVDLAAEIAETQTDVTVTEYLTRWLTQVVPLENRGKTLSTYSTAARLYIDPTIGKIRLRDLTPNAVRSMMNKMLADGRKPNTVRNAHAVLRRALTVAEGEGLVVRNVAKGVKITVPPSDTSSMTPDQARRFQQYATAQGYGGLIAVFSMGLRRGEVLGLRWRDIDLDRPTLTIVGTLSKDEAGAAVWQPEAKTVGSRRTLTVPAYVVTALRHHRKQQVTARFAYGPGWGINAPFDDFVFPSATGNAADPDAITKLIVKLTEEAGVGRWTPHGLRHTAASLMLAQSVPLEVVQELLGHSSIRTTKDVYGHLRRPSFDAAADAMQGLYGGG